MDIQVYDENFTCSLHGSLHWSRILSADLRNVNAAIQLNYNLNPSTSPTAIPKFALFHARNYPKLSD